MATNTLVGLDFLKEVEERFPYDSSDIFEPRRYSYKLTEDGNKIFKEINRKNPSWLNPVKEVMGDIISKEECNYEYLSLSAKMFHILKRQKSPITESELLVAAKNLGWQLTKEKVDRAAKFLKDLKLIKEVS